MEGQRNKSTKDVFKGAEVGIDHEIDGRWGEEWEMKGGKGIGKWAAEMN